MRTARLKGEGHHFVHTLSRVVDRRFIFGDAEKEHFVKLMRKLSAFHQIPVVTFCVMSNHFHLLLEQPDPELVPDLTKDELLRRLPLLYKESRVREIKEELDRLENSGDPEAAARFLESYEKRLGHISVFMKELKQRFTQWYNRRNDRHGTLWEDRYKSVLVEGSEHALMTMAAYIDLNPVRAGMVEQAEDYRWCGYGAAMGGVEKAREGLGVILDQSNRVCGEDFAEKWDETSKLYRLWIYSEGVEIQPDVETGQRGRRGFSPEQVEAVEKEGGQVRVSRALRCRVRYFSDGAVLGSAAFVNAIFEANRSSFGAKRKDGARPMKGMKGCDWGGLCVIRDLRKTAKS